MLLRMNSTLLQPTLQGSLVHLSPMRAEDHDALYAVAKDPLIWEQHPSWDRYKPEVFRLVFDQGLASGGALVVRDASTGEVIGSTRFYDYRPEDPSIAIGYTFIARRCWGGTYNPEMKSLLLQHAFGFVERVWFHIGVTNRRSREAIARVGGQFSHEIFNDPAWGGRDQAYYYIDKTSFNYPAAT